MYAFTLLPAVPALFAATAPPVGAASGATTAGWLSFITLPTHFESLPLVRPASGNYALQHRISTASPSLEPVSSHDA